MAEDIPFKDERALVTDTQLAGWEVTERTDEGAPIEVAGPCPRCGHPTTAEIVLDMVTARAQSGARSALPPPRERVTRIVACACGESHPRPVPAPATPAAAPEAGAPAAPAAPIEESCGRWWLISVALSEGADQPVRAGDESLLQAALAVRAELATEQQRITTAAEKWIAGVAALLSLFGLSGVIVGKDALDGIPTAGAVIAAVIAAVALGAAATAVFLSYRAAYGWPAPTSLSNDEALRTWFERRRDHISSAATDLKQGVLAALGALSALALALAIVWFWPRDDPTPTVKITSEDDSFVCGNVLTTKDAGTMRLRTSTGDVKVIPAPEVRTVAVVSKC